MNPIPGQMVNEQGPSHFLFQLPNTCMHRGETNANQ